MYKCNMRKQDWIFLGNTAEFRLKYDTVDLFTNEEILNEFLKKSKRITNFWHFICYKTNLWRFVKL